MRSLGPWFRILKLSDGAEPVAGKGWDLFLPLGAVVVLAIIGWI